MEQIAEHTFHCSTCNSTKELVAFPMIRNPPSRSKGHYALWFLSAKSVVSALAIGGTLFSAVSPTLTRIPVSEVIGPLALAGYIYAALRFTLRAQGADIE